MNIIPYNVPGQCCDFRLSSSLTKTQIEQILGFEPNVKDDPYKVKNSWGFKVDGMHCGIWDYKGLPWSAYGPEEVFIKLFGEENIIP